MFKDNPGLLGAAILANNGNVGRGFMDASRAQSMASQAQMRNKLAQMQMQQLQAQMAQQKAQNQARTQLGQQYPNIMPWLSAGMSVGDAYSAMNPKDTGKLYQYIGDNGPVYGTRADAMGKQPFTKPLVSVNTGNQVMPTNDEIMRGDVLEKAKNSRTFYNNVITSGRNGYNQLANYDKMLNLLETAQTGTFEESKMALKKAATGLGFDVDMANIPDQETLRVLLGDLVMQRVAQTKGAVSNQEMKLFAQYSANFGNTPEGNRAILNFQKAKTLRDIELAKIARKMSAENKTSIQIEQALWDYVMQHPIEDALTQPGQKQDNIDDLVKQYLGE